MNEDEIRVGCLDNFQSLDEVREKFELIAKEFNIGKHYIRAYSTMTMFEDRFGCSMDFYVPKEDYERKYGTQGHSKVQSTH
jgi:hypothetical protein